MKNLFKLTNISLAWMYAYIHFILEVVCFCFLSRVSPSLFVWLIPFLYDGFAFIPQSLIGYVKDRFPKINVGLIGMIGLLIGISLFSFTSCNKYVLVIIIGLANACLHIEGAYHTIGLSKGKLTFSAIFVGLGAIGVITGRVVALSNMPTWFLLLMIITMLPILIYRKNNYLDNIFLNEYDYVKKRKNKFIIILLICLVIMVRAYLGYRIPSAWNTTTVHTIILFVTMGLGKILGGVLADSWGLKKTACVSTLCSIPFLIFGNQDMLISLIGIMLFSMTMSITLAMLISILPRNPGLAFGLTTIALACGTFPIFFIAITDTLINTLIILILSFLSFLILNTLLKENK